jgi:hypothetical protein
MPLIKGHGLNAGVTCSTHDAALALPALAITLWLVFRALPLRPSIAGLLGGTGAAVTADAINHILCPMSDLRHVLVWHTGMIFGAAVTADAINHILCPMSDLRHVLVWHTGMIFGLMIVGWAAGKIWERRRFG